MTFGWLVGELIRRTDPSPRSLGRFVFEEIAGPIGIPDLWIGVPDAVVPRIAMQYDAMTVVLPEYLPPVAFRRPDVPRAEVAGVGGIFTARSEARFWAMLAGGGELDGVRILSNELVKTLYQPRSQLAVAICYNRLFDASSIEEDTVLTIANAVREALRFLI